MRDHSGEYVNRMNNEMLKKGTKNMDLCGLAVHFRLAANLLRQNWENIMEQIHPTWP